MEIDKKDMKRMHSLQADLKMNNDMLGKSDWVVSKRKKKKLAAKNEEIEIELDGFRTKYNDPEIEVRAHEESVANSKWTKAADKLESAGSKLQSAGDKMTKTGMHATGAVWSPVLYAAYQGHKLSKKQPKNESAEQDLIELINEVEQAHKDGKITEEEKREHIIGFVDNYYR